MPGIAYWKGMIAPGRQSDELFDLMDLFNTALDLAGAIDSIPTDRYIDGIDQTSLLLADDGRSRREKVYIWSEKNLMAMRMYEYKIHLKVVETQAQWLDIDCTAEKAAKGAGTKATVGIGGRCSPAEAAKDSAKRAAGVEDKGPLDKHRDEGLVKKAVK
ncbi:hypothetical protein [Thiocapsa roseopersicina]|uniref:hypothetical protein n=1 Tax=Thiocapsa roseopersicina TaxID=1058 RepID=UPI001C3190DF